jgi:ribose/xylose/arabinose/galactoside ABC-type transport system permease subunit
MRKAAFWERFGIYVITLATLAAFSALTTKMLTISNLTNLLAQAAMTAIAGAGMTFAITSGGFDLSIGSIVALTTCVLGKSILAFGLLPALGIVLVMGLILGILNGLIITKLRIQTFVATLATMIIYRGFSLIYTQGRDVTLYGHLDIKVFSSGDLLGLPVPILITCAAYVAALFVYKRTRFGIRVRSVGSNIDAARASGVPVDRTIILVFALTAVTATISGIILSSQLLTGNGRLGTGFELQAITSVILGGTALSGGRGNVLGTLVAAVMLGIVSNGLNLLGVPEFYQQLSTGIILILALSVGGLGSRFASARIKGARR